MRQAFGFLVGLIGVWTLWGALNQAMGLVAAGAAPDLTHAFLSGGLPLRGACGFAALVGGLTALMVRDVRTWMTTLSAFVFGIVVFSLVANRGNVEEWRSTAIILVVMTGLTLCLIRAQIDRRAAGDGETGEESLA